jgi:hypothetical protein
MSTSRSRAEGEVIRQLHAIETFDGIDWRDGCLPCMYNPSLPGGGVEKREESSKLRLHQRYTPDSIAEMLEIPAVADGSNSL